MKVSGHYGYSGLLKAFVDMEMLNVEDAGWSIQVVNDDQILAREGGTGWSTLLPGQRAHGRHGCAGGLLLLSGTPLLLLW